jgi:hypothetical protein
MVLFAILLVVLLQFVHLFQQQLVLAFQVLVLDLQDSLDRLVVRRLLFRSDEGEVFIELLLEDRPI